MFPADRYIITKESRVQLGIGRQQRRCRQRLFMFDQEGFRPNVQVLVAGRWEGYRGERE